MNKIKFDYRKTDQFFNAMPPRVWPPTLLHLSLYRCMLNNNEEENILMGGAATISALLPLLDEKDCCERDHNGTCTVDIEIHEHNYYFNYFIHTIITVHYYTLYKIWIVILYLYRMLKYLY